MLGKGYRAQILRTKGGRRWDKVVICCMFDVVVLRLFLISIFKWFVLGKKRDLAGKKGMVGPKLEVGNFQHFQQIGGHRDMEATWWLGSSNIGMENGRLQCFWVVSAWCFFFFFADLLRLPGIERQAGARLRRTPDHERNLEGRRRCEANETFMSFIKFGTSIPH